MPGAPPQNITATATSSSKIKVSWQPPPQDRANGRIMYYKLFFVEEGRLDSDADSIVIWNVTEFELDELKKWTEYKIWILAGTSVGDGPRSIPIKCRTHEDGMYDLTRFMNFLKKTFKKKKKKIKKNLLTNNLALNLIPFYSFNKRSTGFLRRNFFQFFELFLQEQLFTFFF